MIPDDSLFGMDFLRQLRRWFNDCFRHEAGRWGE